MYKINILCYLLYLFFITNLFRNRALKIKAGRTDRREEETMGREGEGGGDCKGPVSSKAIPIHSCLKALFCFSKSH